jgi:hypothetical protein
MAFTVYDGILAFAKPAISDLYLECRTAIFNNPETQIYTPKGKITRVREYSAGKAGTYNKTTGWMQSGGYGSGEGVKWVDYYAPYDRAKILSVDAIDEMQSFATGMRPSIELLNENFLDEHLPAEIDATNIATFYTKVPSGNKHLNTASGYETTADKVLGTIIKLETDIFNSGYSKMSVLFVRASIMAAVKTAIIDKYGLAGLLTKTMDVTIDTGLDGLTDKNNKSVSVSTQLLQFSRFYIVEMPDDRMYTKITMLNGYSEGQTDGGYAPDTEAVGYGLIDLLAIPLPAAFTNTRYMIDNLFVPYELQAELRKIDLQKLTSRMYGNIEIGNANVNPKANAFEYDIRAIYGGDIFDRRAKNCFAVTGTLVTE